MAEPGTPRFSFVKGLVPAIDNLDSSRLLSVTTQLPAAGVTVERGPRRVHHVGDSISHGHSEKKTARGELPELSCFLRAGFLLGLLSIGVTNPFLVGQ